MVTHFIFMSSSYSMGTRIALDYIVTDKNVQEELKQHLDKIIKKCGKDVSISTHMIQSDDESWKSVCEADHFFKDVKVISSIDKFIQLILKDRNLEGIDVAKYILSKIKCTQLKLQKLVYLCFADYLCDTGKQLFTDKIYAFKYGPVVDTVYKRYKEYGYKPIEQETEDIDNKNIFEMPAKSRIIFAEDGTGKILSIDKTLRKYGSLSASQLVDLTHKEKTPWFKTFKGTEEVYSSIDPDIIKQYHIHEKIY
ncbi:MAG: Panacea domain-containing protein [Clostridia bacterium]